MSQEKKGVVHIHTRLSRDANMGLMEMKDSCLSAGLSFACITDHLQDLDHRGAVELIHECRRISDDEFCAVPGLELTLDSQTHLLAIGMQTVPDDLGSPTLAAELRAGGSLMVLAHPMLAGCVEDERVLGLVDGVEVWNAAHDGAFFPDPAVLRFCHSASARAPIVCIGGDDLHNRGDRVRVRTVIRAPLSPGEIVGSLRAGRFGIRGLLWTLPGSPQGMDRMSITLGLPHSLYTSTKRLRDSVMRGLSRRRQQ